MKVSIRTLAPVTGLPAVGVKTFGILPLRQAQGQDDSKNMQQGRATARTTARACNGKNNGKNVQRQGVGRKSRAVVVVSEDLRDPSLRSG